ncbi:hypothetical protein TNCT_693191 [Trichonephila clavata]|uniref:Uncharacterized protein n=1 Tax=Trichonephila clavata TaxID=2740835 RepID=A0A8X6HZ46_TRICU|nr:hypothetical protein TNCT_693191 [Trichonephila clavata]
MKHGIRKGGNVQELESSVTQRHPLIQILRSTIIPGHQSPFCTSRVSPILSICPECRLRGPFRPSFATCSPVAWWVRRSRDSVAISIFHTAPMDKARCTRLRSRENAVETHLQLKRLESVMPSSRIMKNE